MEHVEITLTPEEQEYDNLIDQAGKRTKSLLIQRFQQELDLIPEVTVCYPTYANQDEKVRALPIDRGNLDRPSFHIYLFEDGMFDTKRYYDPDQEKWYFEKLPNGIYNERNELSNLNYLRFGQAAFRQLESLKPQTPQ